MQGWILLHRKVIENQIWNDKPFSKGQAWIDLLLMANHKDNTVLLGNEIKEIKRGQFHTSELKLAEKWGWSRNKVRAYLKLLENQKMSTTESTTKGTTITIENYTIYQDLTTTLEPTEPTTKGQRKNIKRTTKGTQTNNDKECRKNENNDKEIKEVYGTFTNVKLTSEEHSKLIEEYGLTKTLKAVEHLSAYKEEKGYKTKSDYLTIKRWVIKAVEEQTTKSKSNNPFLDLLKEGELNE